MQALFVLEPHNTARKLPFLRRTPVELSDLSISKAPGMKLSYFGYEFEIPWADIDKDKSKAVCGDKAIIAFRSGNALMVWSGPPHGFMNDLLKNMKIDRENFPEIYSDEVLRSDYSLMRLIWETTPSTIVMSSSKQKDASQEMLLIVKAICTPGDPGFSMFGERSSWAFKMEAHRTLPGAWRLSYFQ